MSGPGIMFCTCRGSASVELVLVLPVLLVLLALAVDGGRMLADYHKVSKSVRDAARFLARAESGDDNCVPGGLDRSQSSVAGAVRLTMTGRIDGDPATEGLVAGWTAADLSEATTGVSVTLECLNNLGGALRGFYAQSTAVPSIVVRARVPFRFGPGRVFGLGPVITLKVAHKTARIGN